MNSFELPKWGKTLTISISKEMTYKTDFLLKIFAPALVLMTINYNVWRAVYQYNDLSELQGFTLEQMLIYQAWALIVALLARSHRSWNLSEDIRYGRITAFLLYPFDFWKFHMASFIAFQLIQTVIAGLTLFCLVLMGFINTPSVGLLLSGFSIAILVSFLWFVFEFTMGLAAFWLEETWVVRVVFELLAVFLSGAVIPIQLFPKTIRHVLEFTPFPYITSVPVQVFMGSYDKKIIVAMLVILSWIALIGICARTIWRRGLKHYTAAGI